MSNSKRPDRAAVRRGIDGFAIVAFLCAAVLFASVRGTGIWQDEGVTWDIVRVSFPDMLGKVFFRGDGASVMPLYFVLEFLWCGLFGCGELALRSMNWVFGVLALLGAVRIARAHRLPSWTLPLFVLNAPFLYYMNEARPYAAFYACGLWAFHFLTRNPDGMDGRDAARFLLCFWLGCALHMMFLFLGVAWVVLSLSAPGGVRAAVRRQWRPWLVALPFLLALGVYYAGFVFGAPEAHEAEPRAASGIVQIVYSFANIGGLGWSRNDLRAGNLFLSRRIVLGLGAAAVSWAGILFFALRRGCLRDRTVLRVLGASAAALVAFVALNASLGVRFRDRHALCLMPGFALAEALVLAKVATGRPSPVARAAIAAFVCVNVLSGLGISNIGYYAKDDYRGAAEAALASGADHVFFQGDRVALEYYGLRGEWSWNALGQGGSPAGNVNVSVASRAELEELLSRTSGSVAVVACGKPEFDVPGIYRILKDEGVVKNVFSIVRFDSAAAVSAALAGGGKPYRPEADRPLP